MLKIITVCGLGVGSSLIMKMTVDSAMKNLNIKCNIEHWDMGTVKGKPCDVIVTTKEFEKNFKDYDNVVFLENMVKVSEATEKMRKILIMKGIIEGE